jgi:threonine synthase
MRPLRCQGCGREVPGTSPAFQCPNAGDGGDHVLAPAPEPGTVSASVSASAPASGSASVSASESVSAPASDPNPFVRYRARTWTYELARAGGLSDEAFVALVRRIDDAVARIDGRGFRMTPLSRNAGLSDALGLVAPGGVWVKDDTGNVSGSHKGRHLMGLAILGEVWSSIGGRPARPGEGSGSGARLAIASCGNAALAAAVVARAWGRPLDVYIPPDANPRVVARLRELEAKVNVCHRQPGVAGDPCTHAFRRAVAQGAQPFCCQGSDCGLTIEGGKTIAFELAQQLADEGRGLDRLFVQVGGGALASSCAQGLAEAHARGELSRLPRLHPVQTQGAFPLRRAWERLVVHAATALGLEGASFGPATVEGASRDARLAESIRAVAASPDGMAIVERALAHAARNRAEFMWPWETEPHSIAHGILDDETYDWLAVLRGTLTSGGWPVVVSEERLREAHSLGRTAGHRADPTGTSGLAGLLELRAGGTIAFTEAAGVLFTGAER